VYRYHKNSLNFSYLLTHLGESLPPLPVLGPGLGGGPVDLLLLMLLLLLQLLLLLLV
jgi:hypothetical protein